MSDQQDRAAPRTEAGRLFAREFREWLVYEGWEREGWDLDATAREFTKSILAVEREAVTPLPQIDAQRLARAFQIVQSRTTDEHPDWSIADVALEYQRLGVTSETTGDRAMTSEDRAAPRTEAGRLLPVFAEIGDVPFRAPDGTMWENLTDAVLSVEREAGVHEHGQLSYEAAARIVGRLSPPPVAAAPGAAALDRIAELEADVRRFSEAAEIALTARGTYAGSLPVDMIGALEPLRYALSVGARAAEPKPPESRGE